MANPITKSKQENWRRWVVEQIELLQGGGLGSGLGIWKYRTETATPPSSGQIRFDDADVSSATEFYLHETNQNGTDVSAFLSLLLIDGSVLYIQDQSDAANYMLIDVGSVVDSGAYRTYQIDGITEGGTEPTQNQNVLLVTR